MLSLWPTVRRWSGRVLIITLLGGCAINVASCAILGETNAPLSSTSPVCSTAASNTNPHCPKLTATVTVTAEDFANPNSISIPESNNYHSLSTLEKASLLLSNGQNLDAGHKALYDQMMLALSLTGEHYSQDGGNRPAKLGSFISDHAQIPFPHEVVTASMIGLLPDSGPLSPHVLMLIQHGGLNYVFEINGAGRPYILALQYTNNIPPFVGQLDPTDFTNLVKNQDSLYMVGMALPTNAKLDPSGVDLINFLKGGARPDWLYNLTDFQNQKTISPGLKPWGFELN